MPNRHPGDARTDADTLRLQANTTRDKADMAEARVQRATDAADNMTEEAYKELQRAHTEQFSQI